MANTPSEVVEFDLDIDAIKDQQVEPEIEMNNTKKEKKLTSKVTVPEIERKLVLTAPLSLDKDSDGNYRAPNLLKRILSGLASVRPGSDLTHFQLPPVFNLPKSQLQCYGEAVYSTKTDLLSKCGNGESSIDRFISVVAWNISTTRPLIFGLAPYNPILGETHHVSMGSLNVLVEQVSHHPPVSALHATDEKANIEMIWCHNAIPKFYGTYVETEVHGKRELKLLNKKESYIMNCPKLVIRFLPIPRVDWLGTVTIECEQTGLAAELCYKGASFLSSRANDRSVKGKIFTSSSSSSSRILYEINGHWDRIVTLTDLANGKRTVIYNAKETISGLKTPILKDLKGIRKSESTLVWGDVSQALVAKSWDKAKEAKTAVEERERELVKERQVKGETWNPKHFSVFYSKENGWHCSPTQNLVPPAPIVVPL